MIDSKELRIGNLYIGYDGKIQKVDLQFFNLLWLDVDIDEIVKDPVELTEDLLLKLGFFNEFANSWSNHVFQMFKNRGNVAGAEIGDFYISTGQRYVTSFKYLHQLQNIYFFLTGTELDTSKII